MLEAESDTPQRSRFSNAIPFALTVLLLALAYRGALWISDMAGNAPPTPTFAVPPPALQPSLASWPDAPYVEVRAYSSDEPFLFPFKEKGIPDVVKDRDGVLLNREQERRLVSAVTRNAGSYPVAMCWFPRHAFVFYDAFGQPVAEVDICFQCNVVQGAPVRTPDIHALADLVTDLGLPLQPEG